MEMIYYNFWGDSLNYLVKNAQNNRVLNLQYDSCLATIRQSHNDTKLKNHIIENLFVIDYGGDIWLNILKPFWQDYLSRCGTTAPNSNIGEYLIEQSKRWQDHTIEILNQICNYFEPGTLAHFKVSHKVNECISMCNNDLLIYRAQVFIANETTVAHIPAQQSNTRPDPIITAQYNTKEYDNILDILNNQTLTRFYDRLFEIGVFSNDNGYWKWSNNYKVWQLFLFIYFVNSAVFYHRSGEDLADVSNMAVDTINWQYYAGWIKYKGKVLATNSIRSAKERAITHSNNLSTDPIYIALLDNIETNDSKENG